MNSVPLKNKENAPSRPVYWDFSKRDEIGKIGSIDGPEFPVEAKGHASALDTSVGEARRFLERREGGEPGNRGDKTKKIRPQCCPRQRGPHDGCGCRHKGTYRGEVE